MNVPMSLGKKASERSHDDRRRKAYINKWPSVTRAPPSGEVMDIPRNFIEEFHETNRVRSGAVTIVEL